MDLGIAARGVSGVMWEGEGEKRGRRKTVGGKGSRKIRKREEEGREGKGREGKGREGKVRRKRTGGKGRVQCISGWSLCTMPYTQPQYRLYPVS